jgi:Tfp pilus assembly protein PilV
MKKRSEQGFTIVEFMIAASVFGVVMVVVAAAVLFISRSYQNSLYASQTQATASNLIDTLAQSVKFSSTPITSTSHVSGTQSYCIGTKQFLYVIGKQVDGPNTATRTRNAVVVRQNNNCALESIITTQPSGSPQELLGKGMRLAKLTIASSPSSPSIYTVSARVVYGDDDLLCSPSVTNSCESTATMSAADLARSDVTCRPNNGSEFCAVSELSSTVYRRL